MIGRLAKMRLLHLVFIRPHICWADSLTTLNVTWQRQCQTMPVTPCWPQVFNRWHPCLCESLKQQHIIGLWLDQVPLSSEDFLTVYLCSVKGCKGFENHFLFAGVSAELDSFFHCLTKMCTCTLPSPLLCVLIWATRNSYERNTLIQGSQQQKPPTHRSSPSCQHCFGVHSNAINKNFPTDWSMGIPILI